MNHKTIAARCPHCGSDQFIEPGDAQPATQATCARCGRETRLDELTRNAGAHEAQRLAQEFARTLGRKLR